MIKRPDKKQAGTSSDKTLSVMELFTAERPEWTVEEAIAELGLSESTAYRYFRSLAAVGLIFDVRPGRYLLGPGIAHYDRQLRISDPLIRQSEPMIYELAAHYAEPGQIFICRLFRDQVMSMHEHRLGNQTFHCRYDRGQLAPLFVGMPGLAILASMPVRNVRKMYQAAFPGSGEGDAEWLELKRRFRTIRAAGYGAEADQPDEGVIYISAPLLHEDGGVAGSLNLALPSDRLQGEPIALAGRRVAAAAQSICEAVGAEVAKHDATVNSENVND